MHYYLHDLEQKLSALSDAHRAQAQQAYFKSSLPFFGVAKPTVAKIAKELAKKYAPHNHKDYCDTFLYLIQHARHREIWYAGVDYAMQHKKFICRDAIPTYLEVIRFTQWWDIVDVVADHLIGKALRFSDLENSLKAWVSDENMWIRRTALLAQLKYKEATNKELLAYCIQKTMHEKEFFIRKAIGWSLRSYAYTNPEWVREFVKTNQDLLSNLSKREALKNIL